MIVPIVFALILVIVIPVGFLITTAVVAATLGDLLRSDAEGRNAGSELVETNY
jgi:hypothetical protein